MTPVQLPEVPAPIGHLHSDDDFCRTVPIYPDLWPVDVYTAAQLREYATQAVMAERARVLALASAWEADGIRLNGGSHAPYTSEENSVRAFILGCCADDLVRLLNPSETNSER